jgi:hypothetical protein
MSQKTDVQLSEEAQQIKNETARKANTASRVGTHLQNLVDSKLNKQDGVFTRWNFATSGPAQEPPLGIGAYPTDLTKMYVAVDDSVLPANTWFVSDGAGGWLMK